MPPADTAVPAEAPVPVRRSATPGAMLAVLAAAELLGMSLWFAATAVGPQLRERWHLSAAESGWLTAIVQLGFVAGTTAAAALNLADVLNARAYFTVSALLAAAANLTVL